MLQRKIINLDEKVFGHHDIQLLWEVIKNQIILKKKNTDFLFSVVLENKETTSAQTINEADKFFEKDGLLNCSKIIGIHITYDNPIDRKSIQFHISEDDHWWNDYAVVLEGENSWVLETHNQLNRIIDNVENRTPVIKSRRGIIAIVVISVIFILIVSKFSIWDNTTYTLLIASVLGISMHYLHQYLRRMWPIAELDIGPQHKRAKSYQKLIINVLMTIIAVSGITLIGIWNFFTR